MIVLRIQVLASSPVEAVSITDTVRLSAGAGNVELVYIFNSSAVFETFVKQQQFLQHVMHYKLQNFLSNLPKNMGLS
jgi:hypothetical protein